MDAWLRKLFDNGDFLKMGHCQRLDDANLGMGWLYYGLARLIRCKTIVVIGSWRGFTPIVFAKALRDNVEGGQVVFIDPSLVDDFWKDPAKVAAHFAEFEAPNVVHHAMTTQQFIATHAYRALTEIGMVFIDGYHTAEQAQIDFEAFAPLLAPNGLALFHDSRTAKVSTCYGVGREYECTVPLYIDELARDPKLQVLDLDIASGLTIVRRA